MDLFDSTSLPTHDFFEDSHLAGRCPLPQVQVTDSMLYQDALLFSPQPYLQSEKENLQVEISQGLPTTPTSHSLPSPDDTNHLEEFLGNKTDLSFEQSLFQLQKQQQLNPLPEQQSSWDPLSPSELEKIIEFLVEHASANIQQTYFLICQAFPSLSNHTLVRTLVEKFAKLKKTKQELIKYCMRKAFKFVLELPKKEHLLIEQKDRLSFSKGKSRFLRKVSEEKSMNSKFLSQVFREGDFSHDYYMFLQQFQSIMIEDNTKKLKYLASLLANGKQSGEGASVQMVRRLPWTRAILEKVLKISRELLKFSAVK